jgi:hypothetical protein
VSGERIAAPLLGVALRRLRRLKAWEADLVRRVEGIGFLRVADVPSEEQRPAPRLEEVAEIARTRLVLPAPFGPSRA